MAKRKTPKADKVVDLKPRAERISNEQLQKASWPITYVNDGSVIPLKFEHLSKAFDPIVTN